MRRRNTLGFLITAVGLVAASAAGARANARSGDDEKALRLLVKAFDRESPRNVVAIMRMGLDTPGERQTVQVQIAKDGYQRVEVIEPLERAGIVIFELGDIRMIINKDKGTVSIGRSMGADLFKPDERLRLVRRNYTLRMTPDIWLAHRRTVRIDATSHYADVGGSKIYIDPESFFVMRVDAISASGALMKRFETTAVEYPNELPPGTFEIGKTYPKTNYESAPEPVSNVSEAVKKGGFRPLTPHELPYGFITRKMYVRSDPAYKTIGFDLSDGLAAATVFEFDLRHCPATVANDIRAEMRKRPGDYISSGDIIVGVVSKLDSKARKKILDAFRPKHHSAMNDAENFFNGDQELELSLGLGTNSCSGRVTSYRRMWRVGPMLG